MRSLPTSRRAFAGARALHTARLLQTCLIVLVLVAGIVAPGGQALAGPAADKAVPTPSVAPSKGQPEAAGNSAQSEASQSGGGAIGLASAWGNNHYGQLGNPTNNNTDSPNSVPARIEDRTYVTAVAAGAGHSLALKSDGSVWAWGSNLSGQLGNGITSGAADPGPVPQWVTGLGVVTAVEAGDAHSLALQADGTVWTWGSNLSGQLGNVTNAGSSDPNPAPAQVIGLSGVSAIAAGAQHSLALRNDGTVFAWGNNHYGQLGRVTSNNTDNPNPALAQVAGLSGIIAIAAGESHSLALRSDGAVFAWGRNFYGQLGNNSNAGNNSPNPAPVQVVGLAGVIAIAAGQNHSLALKGDGSVFAWGSNQYGQLGKSANSGTITPNPAPAQIAGLSAVTALAAGDTHSLARQSDGAVFAWGQNFNGQLGNPTNVGSVAPNTVPALVANFGGASALAAGSAFSLALKSDGTVWGWGVNSFGQLGNSVNNDTSFPNPAPLQVTGLDGLKGLAALAAGSNHTLALRSDGTVWAWGSNLSGQLGRAANSIPNPQPAQVAGLSGVIAVEAGDLHSLALRSDGTVWAWGSNQFGQLGNNTNSGNTNPNPTPMQVGGLSGVTAIAAGQNHSLALKTDGTVWAWGLNFSGQLGRSANNSGFAANPTPHQAGNLAGLIAIAAGGNHSLAIGSNGTIFAWGSNFFGQLGIFDNLGNNNPNPAPTQITTLGAATAIAAGQNHSLALRSDGTVFAWGHNRYGQLGSDTNNGADNANALPTQISGLVGAVGVSAIAAGGDHSLALKSDGSVFAWGRNSYGQLGNLVNSGGHDANPTPAQVAGLTGVSAIAAGGNDSLALRAVSGVATWGWIDWPSPPYTRYPALARIRGLSGVIAIDADRYGSLALKSDGSVWEWVFDDNLTPTQVQGLSGIIAIATGEEHFLALKSDGTVWAWGGNTYGQLGTGTSGSTPAQVGGISGVVAIAAGENHSLALKSDGSVWAWGDNFYGQLGNPTNYDTEIPNTTPLQVGPIGGVSAIAAGWFHSMALESDGSVWAWGLDDFGQLGTGTSGPTPAQVGGIVGVSAISAGSEHSMALQSDGSVRAWGSNRFGQLGSTTTNPSAIRGAAIAAGYYHSLALVDILSSGTSLTSSANPTVQGQQITFTATVTSTAGIPSGSVTFKDGATTLGTVNLTAGSASLSTSTLSPGTHTITADYSGDADFYYSSTGRTIFVHAAPESVAWIDAVGVISATNIITRDNTIAAWSAGATSNRAINAGFGFVQAKVGAANDNAIFGLGSGNDDQTGNDIEFGVYLNGTTHTAQAIEKNTVKGSPVSFTPADTFRVAVEPGPVVNYYKNDVAFYTNHFPTLVYPLRLDTALYNPGAAIRQALISGIDLATVDPRIPGSAGVCNNVVWNPNPGYTTNVTTNVAANTIRKTSGANNAWNAGNSSSQSFNSTLGAVSASAVVNSPSDYFLFGLSAGDSNAGFNDVDWGIYGYGANGTIKAVYQGATVATLGNIAAGDVLRLEFSATQVRFFNNGVPLLVGNFGAGGNPFFPALLDTSFYKLNSGLNDVKICSAIGTSRPAAASSAVPQLDLATTKQPQRDVSFADVHPGAYYHDAVRSLAGRGVLSGYADGTFRPNSPVTRGQLAKIVVLALGEPLRQPARPTFADVPLGSPFFSYVETAVWMGMVSGYADGSFHPNAPVTRGQLAKLVALGAALPLVEAATAHFRDVTPGNPFFPYIETAYAHGLISGYDDGAFRPAAGATRAQVTKIVYQALTATRK